MKKLILIFAMLLTPHAIAADTSAKWAFGFHVGYSPNYLVAMSNSGVQGTTPYAQTFEMEYESSPEYGVDIWHMPKNDWGFVFAADSGAARKMTKLTINGQVLTPQPGQQTATFQTHFIRLGTAYRWETFYLPMGLTYGVTAMTMPSSGTLSVKGGVGAFFGIGWNFGDTFAIEYLGRSSTMQYDYKSTTTTEHGDGIISSAMLNIKLLF